MIQDIKIVTQLGHLTVYRKLTMAHPFGDGSYYYCDKRFLGEYGPFSSTNDAVRHWGENIVPKVGELPVFPSTPSTAGDIVFAKPDGTIIEDAVPNNVIYVDFQLKKRSVV